jgi:hypothetical protein
MSDLSSFPSTLEALTALIQQNERVIEIATRSITDNTKTLDEIKKLIKGMTRAQEQLDTKNGMLENRVYSLEQFREGLRGVCPCMETSQ